MKIGIKYCGGCNPYHNRRQFVKNLEKEKGIETEIAKPGILYDELYVVCGCQVCCANISGLEGRHIFFVDHHGIRE